MDLDKDVSKMEIDELIDYYRDLVNLEYSVSTKQIEILEEFDKYIEEIREDRHDG